MAQKQKSNYVERLASAVTVATGSTPAIIIAFLLIVVWGITGPVFHYSETWQLVINTGTTIITFLMVFLIQKSQNKESMAVQLKLNEILAANQYTSNRMIDVEDMTEEELQVIKKYYCKLKEMAERETPVKKSYSIDQAKLDHERKTYTRAERKSPKNAAAAKAKVK